MDFAVLPAASLYFFVLTDGEVVGLLCLQRVKHQVHGVLELLVILRTSIALMNSMRVEKFCSSTGAS